VKISAFLKNNPPRQISKIELEGLFDFILSKGPAEIQVKRISNDVKKIGTF